MNREVHARFWERLGVKLLRATRQFENVSLGHGVSLLRWRSGGVEHPHDTPPYPFMPSPTFGLSSPLGINNPSGGAEANQFSFELAYDTGSGQRGEQQNINEGIVFTITKAPDATWSVVENCKELSFE